MVNAQLTSVEPRTRRRTKPALGPEARNREARMRAMIDAAIDLYAEEGYGAVSTRRVAERANCSETLLFRYFGGKRGLLLAICAQPAEAGAENPARSAECETVGEFVEQYILGMFKVMRENAPVHKIVTAALIVDPELTADFEARHDEQVELVVERLRHYQQRGQIGRDVDLTAIAAGIEQMAFAVGFLMQILYNRSQDELETIARSVAAAMSQGLRDASPTALLEADRLAAIDAARIAAAEINRAVGLLETATPEPKEATAPRKRRRNP